MRLARHDCGRLLSNRHSATTANPRILNGDTRASAG